MIENMTLRVPSLSESVAAYHALGYEDAGTLFQWVKPHEQRVADNGVAL